ncbi:MAG: 3-isopropylmalate dehydratase large subunit [bacterium]
MGMTFVEKTLARYAQKDRVVPGEIVIVEPDLYMSHDNTAAIRKIFEKIGVEKLKYPERALVVLDHCAPAMTAAYAQNHKEVREFVAQQGIKSFYDINVGICHQVMAENGHIVPGRVVVGSDSHTPTSGAFGTLATGIGRTEVAALWATGSLWFRVPETLKVVVHGKLQDYVYPKDLILKIIGEIRADGALYRAVEFCGEAIEHMSISGRMTLCNMTIEMGAKCGYVSPDEKTWKWLEEHGVNRSLAVSNDHLFSDEDAVFERVLEIDASTLEPQVSCPHTVDNVKPVSAVVGTKIQQAFLGTCTNGRLDDIAIAAKILEGKKIHSAVRFLVIPASQSVYLEAMDLGFLKTIIQAGGVVMNSGCGPCMGAYGGIPANGEVCISTANRNFKGRMGNKESEVYLASPATVTAAAVAGEIVSSGTQA